MSAVASDPMFVVPDPFRPVYSDSPPSPCLRVHIPNATIPTAAAPLPATSWSSMGTRMPTMVPCICIRRQAAPALIGGVLMAHMGGE